MTTSQKSQAEISKLNSHRRRNGEFGNRDHAESSGVLLTVVPEATEDEINNPWGVEIVEPELVAPTPVEAPVAEPVVAPKITLVRDRKDRAEATGASAETLASANQTLSSDQEIIFGSAFRNPDDSLDKFCAAHPNLPQGNARRILHEFVTHVERNPDSQYWTKTMSERIAQAEKPVHPSFVMAPGDTLVDKASSEVFIVASEIERAEENQRRIARNYQNQNPGSPAPDVEPVSVEDKWEKINFHGMLPHLSAAEADEAFQASLSLRRMDHEDWKQPIKDASRKNASKQGHKFDYDYTPPGAIAVKGYGPNASHGSLYTGYRDVTEINKDARAELNRAQKAGYLPKDLKFSVRGEKFSGGQAMRVSVKGVDKETQVSEDGHRRYSDLGGELHQRIDTIINAWNHEDNDAQTDYFNTSYYSSISYN